MDKDRNTSYVQLLSDPTFDFTPYFDEAVMSWLNTNMSRFLAEQPSACKHIMRMPSHIQQVATVISLDDEATLIEFLNILQKYSTSTESYFSPFGGAFKEVIRRLDNVGKMQVVMTYHDLLARYPTTQMFKHFDDVAWDQIIERFSVGESTYWDSGLINAFFKHIPVSKLSKFITAEFAILSGRRWRTTGAHVASIIAQRIDKTQTTEFMSVFGPRYQPLQCMSCTQKIAKSRPGYTLHRKVCDPTNEFPNIFDVVLNK